MEKIGQITYSRSTYREIWAEYIQQNYIQRKFGRLHTAALHTERIGQILYSIITHLENWADYIQQKYLPKKLGRLHTAALRK
jgi:hypothetical protein